MLVQRTMVGDTTGQSFQPIDTISHDGALWLVPLWIDFPDEGVKRPLRIIRLTGLPFQVMPLGWKAAFLLNTPIPAELLRRPAPARIPQRFVVVEAPDISVPIRPLPWS